MRARGGEATSTSWGPGPGDRLGKFILLQPIGEGGMARLYLARTEGLGGFEKRVVIKQILPRLAEDGEFIARFIQEARLAATLDHPNIAAVYEVDLQDGVYFYSMEYVQGYDLHRVLKRAAQRGRTLAAAEIVAVIAGLCGGLHHAHTRRDDRGRPLGIVHRDVSPSNVLLSFEGAVKLTDFGVAKARTSMVSTEAGTLRGKIPYMSPEQCRGEAIDRRSDVYAAGVLMWEMITGRRLHHAEGELALLQKIAHNDAQSPRVLRPECPERLETIVMRALARDPAVRYASARALQVDLEEFARSERLATSSRTVADLMHALFEEGPPRVISTLDGAEEATTAAVDLRGSSGRPPTPPTGTVDPMVRRSIPAMTPISSVPTSEGIVPSASYDEAEPRPPRRHPWAGVAVGLGFGVVLGGGGLYVASAKSKAPAPNDVDRPASVEGAASGSEAVSPSAAGSGARASGSEDGSVELDAEIGAGPGVGEPVRADASTEPGDASGSTGSSASSASPADSERASSASDRRASRKARRRRAAKGRRTKNKPTSKSVNLDSPLPPGFDGR
ncbi:MAG: protein kinase [Myxococcota bacterium]